MQIKSTSFDDNQPIPSLYTCKGDGVSPPLAISAVPENAVALALWMHDPDAPSGDFTHWIAWNIDPSTIHIAQGTLPATAVEGMNDFGTSGYAGPCPPAGTGTHHYIFELFALTQPVILNAKTTAKTARSAFARCTAAHAILTGTATA